MCHRNALWLWVWAALAIVAAGPARACYCTPIVQDPDNIAQTMEVVSQTTQANGILGNVQSNGSNLLGAFGSQGGLNLGGLGSIGGLLSQSSSSQFSMGSVGSCVSSMLNKALGQSGLLSMTAPLSTANLFPGGNAACGAAGSALASGMGGGMAGGSSVFGNPTSTLSWVQTTLRGPLSGGTNAQAGLAIEQARKAEYHDAIDQAEASALFHGSAASAAAQRWQALNTQAQQAANGGTDLRSQLGLQLLALNQTIIALGEEISAMRALTASATRVQAAYHYSLNPAVGQVAPVGSPGAVSLGTPGTSTTTGTSTTSSGSTLGQ